MHPSSSTDANELKEALRAKTEAQEHAARVEALRTTAARRMKNASLARGWGVWVECWAAKVHNIRVMVAAGARLRKPVLVATYHFWKSTWRAYELSMVQMSSAEQLELKDRERAEVEVELDRTRTALASSSMQCDELARRVAELAGGDAQTRAMLESHR